MNLKKDELINNDDFYDIFLEGLKKNPSLKKKFGMALCKHDLFYKSYHSFIFPGLFERLTASIRTLPNFMILGFAKCGTTSLFHYLTQHKNLTGSTHKEPHYFSYKYGSGIDWYKALYPIRKKGLTFEASQTYLWDPNSHKRIKKDLPDCKFIVILRNPIEQCYSYYQHMKNGGLEKSSFEDCIKQDKQRLLHIMQHTKKQHYNYFKMPVSLPYVSFAKYDLWLKPFLDSFKNDRFLFLASFGSIILVLPLFSTI